jgi:mRNA interferase MazF
MGWNGSGGLRLMVNRGEVWKIDLDPARGTEIKKKRSCVIISTNYLNKWGYRFVVVPLTSKKVDQIFPFEVPIFFKGKKGQSTLRPN